MITKDGVTVFRALGFENAVAHCLMEAARDPATRTAQEAGDGTTTATILAEAFVRLTVAFCKANPSWSPQKVKRILQDRFTSVMLPELQRCTIRADLESDEGRKLLHAVAKISANGDEALADAVMQCFDICGDEGNVTILETPGSLAYEVEKVEGYPIAVGFEESAQKYYPAFVNDAASQRVLLDKPIFVLYFGRLSQPQTLMNLLTRLQDAWAGNYLRTPNVVLVATGFSESVITNLAQNFPAPGSINIVPLLVPQTPIPNGQRHFLDDLAAVVGATVFDPLTHPLEDAQFEELGNLVQEGEIWTPRGVKGIEIGRYRTTVLGVAEGSDPKPEGPLMFRISEVKAMAEFSESELDLAITRERLAKLTGGIAKLRVVGSSNGDLKERRDRAEDAVCAVRGALREGCLVGGGWMLARLICQLPDTPIDWKIIAPALRAPVQRLFSNIGFPDDEAAELVKALEYHAKADLPETFDAAKLLWVNGLETGLLDSYPAVKVALETSISIASVMGTLGGVIVQPRDLGFERKDGRDAAEFDRFSKLDVNDERQ